MLQKRASLGLLQLLLMAREHTTSFSRALVSRHGSEVVEGASAHTTPLKVGFYALEPSGMHQVPQKRSRRASKVHWLASRPWSNRLDPAISNYPSKEVDHHNCQRTCSLNPRPATVVTAHLLEEEISYKGDSVADLWS